jgi:hypothetical protein
MTQSPHTLSMASMCVCDTVLYKTCFEVKDDSLNPLASPFLLIIFLNDNGGKRSEDCQELILIHFISIKYGTRDINFPPFSFGQQAYKIFTYKKHVDIPYIFYRYGGRLKTLSLKT